MKTKQKSRTLLILRLVAILLIVAAVGVYVLYLSDKWFPKDNGTVIPGMEWEENTPPLGERTIAGLKVFALGLGAVFAVLILIWWILEGIGFLMKRATVTPSSASPEFSESSAAATDSTVADGDEIIAAITAAIGTILDSESADEDRPPIPKSSFRVVSFKKKIQ